MTQRGFTIIELVVVIAVVGIVSTVTVIQFQGASQGELQRARDLFVTDVRRTQQLARAGSVVDGKYRHPQTDMVCICKWVKASMCSMLMLMGIVHTMLQKP